jgi:hypothetical protein
VVLIAGVVFGGESLLGLLRNENPVMGVAAVVIAAGSSSVEALMNENPPPPPPPPLLAGGGVDSFLSLFMNEKPLDDDDAMELDSSVLINENPPDTGATTAAG